MSLFVVQFAELCCAELSIICCVKIVTEIGKDDLTNGQIGKTGLDKQELCISSLLFPSLVQIEYLTVLFLVFGT